ncbi:MULTISPECIES: hypothetical protein [unclassified Shewanella]|uniref:hypothetical protein n=1 Tax=unclassified Shewanella TaxID=196818 RepID=UPI001569CED2|nr:MULTISPECIES: hypothetical protein [unclassified Shewanella]MCU8059000.1 hypothetical protein [Shewanella sp. SM35]MCU8067917.1 hypothetical protein [Shewanella sp. SM34]
MTNREIITLMHTLSHGRIGPCGNWVRVFNDSEELDDRKFSKLLKDTIQSDIVLIYQSSINVTEAKASEAFEIVAQFVKHGVVKIADVRFTSQIEIDPLGVGAVYRTNK